MWRAWSLSKRAELFFRIRQLVDEHRDDLARLLTAEHGKVLSDAHGEVRAGIEVIEYAAGSRAAQGRLLGAGLDGHRRLLDPPAARRRRRHHAVQLPGDGAHVDVGAGHRLRQHVRAEALGEGPVRLDPHGRAAQGGRPARTASSTSYRATRSPSTRSSRTRTSRPSASSARRRSRATSTRRARRPGSGCRRSAARRTT